MNDRWTFGISAAGLTGGVFDYDDNWAGRFQATDVDLIGVAEMPAVSFKANEMISVGLALPVMYSDLELKIRIPNPNDPAKTAFAMCLRYCLFARRY